jgi:hypothetical protein
MTSWCCALLYSRCGANALRGKTALKLKLFGTLRSVAATFFAAGGKKFAQWVTVFYKFEVEQAAVQGELMAGTIFAFPGAWVDGVVLPLLAAAYEEHDEAEDEHDGSPGEIEVDAHGFFVDAGGVAGEEAVEAHEASDEEEDEAEGDADV